MNIEFLPGSLYQFEHSAQRNVLLQEERKTGIFWRDSCSDLPLSLRTVQILTLGRELTELIVRSNFDSAREWTELIIGEEEIRVYERDPASDEPILMVRPLPPPSVKESKFNKSVHTKMCVVYRDEWEVGDLVDWWYHHCWWAAKVISVVGDGRFQVLQFAPMNKNLNTTMWILISNQSVVPWPVFHTPPRTYVVRLKVLLCSVLC